MPAPPSVAPFADVLADLAHDFRRGACCLVVCDKGWTLPIYGHLKERLSAANVRCGYLDGKVEGGETGVIPASVAQMRWAVRAPEAEGIVFAVPHLDIVTATEGGWTPVSREVVALLYENPLSVWLGFQDPSLKLPALVEKVFARRYVIETPYRSLETVRHRVAPIPETSAEPALPVAATAGGEPSEGALPLTQEPPTPPPPAPEAITSSPGAPG
ncbi:MAG TPA: hypothetical protein VGE74_27665 [Gemmata sp.]